MQESLYILISGRDRDGIDLVGQCLSGEDGLDIKVRLLSGGLPDPLFGLSPLPDILILALGADWEQDLESIYARPPGDKTQIVVVAREENAQLMRMAMQAGVRDFYSYPIPEAELIACLRRVGKDRQGQPHQATGDGVMTAVINANGGSGASLISCNIAHIMAQRLDKKVALLDMDLQFGSLSAHLNLEPRESIVDALAKVNDMDIMALEGYMTKHASGLRLLSSNYQFMPQPWTVSVPELRKLLKLVKSAYGQIVLDLPRVIDPFTNTVIEEVDNILIVLEQRITHIRSAKRMLRIVTQELAVPLERIHLVVNRFDKRNPLLIEDVSQALEVESLMVIPNDYERVLEAVNMGIPLLQSAKNAPITQAMVAIAEKFAGEIKTGKKGFFKSAFSQLLT